MSFEIAIVLAILGVTIIGIVLEVVRIDVVAVGALLALVWVRAITPEEALSGFSSHAVVAIMGVMIMGRGLYLTGVADRIADAIRRVAGSSRRRILSTVSLTVGAMSGVMQNIGAAALFLPVMTEISKKERLPLAGLLMPMGFAALIGGTLTMVGTSSLIILNDLIARRDIAPFGLFSVTPIGVALLLSGLAYFALAGELVLPRGGTEDDEDHQEASLLEVWGLSDTIRTYRIPPGTPLVGMTLENARMVEEYRLNLMRASGKAETDYELWKGRPFEAGQRIVVQGEDEDIARFAADHDLEYVETTHRDHSRMGFIEVVIPARSSLVDKTIRELALRETYRAQVLLFFSDSQVVTEGVADRPIRAGDTLILHGRWENLRHFKESEDYILVTPIRSEPRQPEKAAWAVSCFAGAILLVFLSGLPISIGFLTGALAMVVGDVLTIEDAYRAIEWKVVFLIAGLLPLGIAMESSGAASLIAGNLLGVVEGAPIFAILLVLGALTTAFSLCMSNIAATVLLVPLVLQFTGVEGLSAEPLVLLVGVCAANSFIIPTHHVNALLMTPGGYQVTDYLKAGGGLSVVYLLVSTSMIYFFYL